MNVVTDHGALFYGNIDRKMSSLMSDVTVANSQAPQPCPMRAGTLTGFAVEEVIKSKELKYGGTLRPSYKLIPLAFSA